MKTTQIIAGCAAALALVCLGTANVHAGTSNLVPVTDGSWDSSGAHSSTSSYQIGYSLAHPNKRAAYFVYDLTPLKGKTITGLGVVVAGSTDFHITDVWSGHPAGQTANQYRVAGCAQCNPAPQYAITLSQILTGPNSKNLYINATDQNRNRTGGYAWVQDGLHPGQYFGFWHYSPPIVWMQNEFNAGGQWAFWYVGTFDNGAGNENYIWGSTAYTAANTLRVNYN